MDIASVAKYSTVIGLEVHVQLSTESKLFASDANRFGDTPNTNISVITLGHPGTLPKVNRAALGMAIKMGLACESKIAREMIFDRKNYFYPDLPKGYQITQDRTPICVGGQVLVTVDGSDRAIPLNRIHLEEDAGKLSHQSGAPISLVDFNRAGTPLIEIVTEPEIHSSAEAFQFLTEVRKLIRYLDISDGNMEEGSMRCDANVSVKLHNADKLGTKVEVKNLNSMRNVKRSIEYEVERQIKQLEVGETVISETRTFHERSGSTEAIREKETLTDYRYFPDPDLGKVTISDAWLKELKASMPTLPRQLKNRFMLDYQLSEYDAGLLTDSRSMALYFESLCEGSANYKANANWLLGPVKSHLNQLGQSISDFPLSPERLAPLIALVDRKEVSFSVAAQRIFPEMVQQPGNDPVVIAQALGLMVKEDSQVFASVVKEVLDSMPEKVKAYKNGKKGLLGLFMGQIMKKTNGAIDPTVANELLRQHLD